MTIKNRLVPVNKVSNSHAFELRSLKVIISSDNIPVWIYLCEDFLITVLCFRLKKLKFVLGCPSSCKCEEFGEDQDKKILVTGEDLLTVPSNLPFNTGAVYVMRNLIDLLACSDGVRLVWSNAKNNE